MKNILKCLVLFFVMPIIISATDNYNDALLKSNNYINTENNQVNFSSRNKYLIYGVGTPYSFSEGKNSVNSLYRNGGMINKDEFQLSILNNSSYLLSGFPYWTMTQSANGHYILGVYKIEDSLNSNLIDTKITEFVRPNVKTKGSGSYSDPWYFVAGYDVRITTNNKEYGYFGKDESGKEVTTFEKMVEVGQNLEVPMTIKEGYNYTFRDDCGIKKTGSGYAIMNIQKDINCVAYFSEKVYGLKLETTNATTNPEPQKIYYKYNDGFYNGYDVSRDATAERITKIEKPTRVGYDFKGYTFDGVKVIDENGNIISSYSSLNSKLLNDDKTNTSTEKTLKIVWEARTDTKYVVKHLQEECDGTYTLKDTDNLQGTSDTNVTPNTKTYTGYTSPTKQTKNLNADGSLVIEYKYARGTHSVSVAKGSGISTVSGSGNYKYGCNYTIGATVSTGYTWKNYTGSSTITDITKTLTMGTTDVSYTANAEDITKPMATVTVYKYDSSKTNNMGDVVKTVQAFTSDGTLTVSSSWLTYGVTLKIDSQDSGSGLNTIDWKWNPALKASDTGSDYSGGSSQYTSSLGTRYPTLTGNGYRKGQWIVKDKSGNTLTITIVVKIDTVKPTCTFSVATSGITLNRSDNVQVNSYGLNTSTTAEYNSTSTKALATGTYYGHVKDNAGNTGSCQVSIGGTKVSSYKKITNTCNVSIINYTKTTKTCNQNIANYTKTTRSCGRTISHYTCRTNATIKIGGHCSCQRGMSKTYGTCTKNKDCICPSGWSYPINSCTVSYSCSSGTLSGKYCYKYNQSSCGSWSISSTYYSYNFNSAKTTVNSCSTGTPFACNYPNFKKSYVSDCDANYSYSFSTSNSVVSGCSKGTAFTCNKNNSGSSYVSSCVANNDYTFESSTSTVSSCSKESSFTCNASNNGKSYVSDCTPTYVCSSNDYTKLNDSWCYK